MGDMDNGYLNNAVYILEEFLEGTTNPYYGGSVEYGDRQPHCYSGHDRRYWFDQLQGDDGRQRGGRDAGVDGDETEAWGDAGYQGVDKRPENRGCDVAWQVAMKLARSGRRRGGGREAQGIGAGEGGASVLVCEAALRVR